MFAADAHRTIQGYMVKQNLANRLAAGGFWAMKIAQMTVEITQHMRDDGVQHPIVDRTDTEVFVVSGVGAFQHFCNANMEGLHLHMAVELPPAAPQCYDIYGVPISRDEWLGLHENEQYRRIGVWHNEDSTAHVSTIWTGMDTNGCEPPHLFETLVVYVDNGQPRMAGVYKTTCLGDAREGHRRVVELVKEGRL